MNSITDSEKPLPLLADEYSEGFQYGFSVSRLSKSDHECKCMKGMRCCAKGGKKPCEVFDSITMNTATQQINEINGK